MNVEEIAEFVKTRDEAFVSFVRTGDLEKFYAYCKKYGVKLPEDETVMKAGILKAVQECTDISRDVKMEAALQAVEMGYSPFVNWDEVEYADAG